MSQEAYTPGSPSGLCINSFNQDLLRVCNVPGTVHGIGDTVENKIDSAFCPYRPCVYFSGEIGSKQLPIPSPSSMLFPFLQM